MALVRALLEVGKAVPRPMREPVGVGAFLLAATAYFQYENSRQDDRLVSVIQAAKFEHLCKYEEKTATR